MILVRSDSEIARIIDNEEISFASSQEIVNKVCTNNDDDDHWFRNNNLQGYFLCLFCILDIIISSHSSYIIVRYIFNCTKIHFLLLLIVVGSNNNFIVIYFKSHNYSFQPSSYLNYYIVYLLSKFSIYLVWIRNFIAP